jgi:hypothetical protein
MIGLPLLAVVAVAGLAVWFVLDEFFATASRFVSVVSLSMWLLFMRLFQRALGHLHEPGANDYAYLTQATAFSLAAGFFWYWHGMRLWVLARDERASVARRGSPEALGRRLLANLTTWRHQSRSRTAPMLLLGAKMVQGLSAFTSLFAFGGMLFNVTMLSLALTGRIPWKGQPATGSIFGSEDAWGISRLLGAIVIVFAVTLSTSFVLTQLAMWMKRLARTRARSTFEDLVAHDGRPHILFLRSFSDDQVTLPRLPLSTAYWLAEPNPRRLDHVLVERFSHLAPIVALGKPGDTDLAFGAARIFVPAGAEWRDLGASGGARRA